MVSLSKRTHRGGCRRRVAFHKCGWPLALTLGGLLPLAPVGAQQTYSSSPPTPKTVAGNDASVDVLPEALVRDPRFGEKVTLTRHDITIDDALTEFTRQTKVPLAAATNGVGAGAVTIAVKDLPLREALRALAAVYDDHWKRAKTPDGQDCLLLVGITDDPRYWDTLRPHSQGEADEHQAILSFADAAEHLPADVRQALAVDNGDGGVPYANLPPAMQQAAQDALRPEVASLADQHIPVRLSADNMGATRVSLHVKTERGLTDYSLNVVGDGLGNLRFGFQQPDDPRLQNETVLPAAPVPWQTTHLSAQVASYNAARDKSVQDDPRLAQSVSLKTDDCSVGYPLVALSDLAHVPIIAQTLPETHAISFGPVPLREALDQVAAKYRGAWTVTSDGVVVFHTLVRGLPGFWTPEELAERDAVAKAILERMDRDTAIRLARPGVPLIIDGVPYSADASTSPGH